MLIYTHDGPVLPSTSHTPTLDVHIFELEPTCVLSVLVETSVKEETWLVGSYFVFAQLNYLLEEGRCLIVYKLEVSSFADPEEALSPLFVKIMLYPIVNRIFLVPQTCSIYSPFLCANILHIIIVVNVRIIKWYSVLHEI